MSAKQLNDRPTEKRRQILLESIVGLADLNRLKRELEGLCDTISQLGLSMSVIHSSDLPRVSQLLTTFASINKLDLLLGRDRQALLRYINALQKSPVVTIAFASPPNEITVRKIVGWFRENSHPSALLSVEVRPSLIAGFTVRTTNKLFDFSARTKLNNSRDMLKNYIREAVGA